MTVNTLRFLKKLISVLFISSPHIIKEIYLWVRISFFKYNLFCILANQHKYCSTLISIEKLGLQKQFIRNLSNHPQFQTYKKIRDYSINIMQKERRNDTRYPFPSYSVSLALGESVLLVCSFSQVGSGWAPM